MNGYLGVMIARDEYELRVRSMAPVHDFDGWIPDDPPPWVYRTIGQLLCKVAAGLNSIGERMRNGRGIVMNTPLPEHEVREAPG